MTDPTPAAVSAGTPVPPAPRGRDTRAPDAALRARFVASRYQAAQARIQAMRARAQSPSTSGVLVRANLPRDPRSAAVARRLLEARMTGIAGDRVADASIVVTELVSNAWAHGDGPIQLTVRRHDGRLRVDVIDHGRAAEIPHCPSCPDRGLGLVQHLALRWGVRSGVTHVWAELALG